MESIKLTGFKNTQGSPVTPDTRGLVHVSDAESGCGRGWRAASPQLRAGSRAGDRFLSLGTGRASSKGQRPTCHLPGLPPGRKESSSPVSVKKLERVALARKLFRSQEGPPPPRPSRHPQELKQKLGLRLVSTHGDGLSTPRCHISTGVSLSPVNTAPLPSHPTPRLTVVTG